MKLLLDENLSHRMVAFLESAYPGSTQVNLAGMARASDREIWEYSRKNDFVIVTQDSDFHELSLLYGSPPKVVWLQTGNQSRQSVINTLLGLRETIEVALADQSVVVIEIA
jgi:predicted nuclease of predicted toxin-antitoxin system